MSQTVDQIWLDYARKVIPLNAPEVQFDEMKKAFFCGAFAALTTTIEAAELLTEDEAMAFLAGRVAECRTFVEEKCLKAK